MVFKKRKVIEKIVIEVRDTLVIKKVSVWASDVAEYLNDKGLADDLLEHKRTKEIERLEKQIENVRSAKYD